MGAILSGSVGKTDAGVAAFESSTGARRRGRRSGSSSGGRSRRGARFGARSGSTESGWRTSRPLARGTVEGMSEHQQGDGAEPQDTAIAPGTGHYGVEGQHVALLVHGLTRDEIRASGRGWDAAADIKDGIVETASASGIKSEGENLTLDTTEIPVRRLNPNGET